MQNFIKAMDFKFMAMLTIFFGFIKMDKSSGAKKYLSEMAN